MAKGSDIIFDGKILSNKLIYYIYRNDCDSREDGVMINSKLLSMQLAFPDNLEVVMVHDQIFCNNKTFTLCLKYISSNAYGDYQNQIMKFLF